MLPFPNHYCPHTPTPRQSEFLDATERELFFGGAAGGGKSVALLMGALQFAHVPGYAALILRKDTQRLALAGGLIPRSHEWLTNTDARWNEARRRWTFPNEKGPPATVTFGYLAKPDDKYRYLSSEFQYIAFDELTELTEEDYLYLFSRLRKPKALAVPLRIRSASNPGNIGHDWVKRRFIEGSEIGVQGSVPSLSDLNPEPQPPHPDRRFIPSFLTDNPHLAADEYRQSLLHLPPLTRERLLNGDWSVQERGVFRADWIRYHVVSGQQCELQKPDGTILVVIQQSDCRRFITVDPAGTSADRERDDRAGSRSFSVIQVWDQPRRRELSHFLILRDQFRDQIELTVLEREIRSKVTTWKPDKVWIEDEKLGHALKAALEKGSPRVLVELVPTKSKDKKTRAVTLANKMERGEVFLPRYKGVDWRIGFESELLAWTGHPRERSDQIDAAAYAAIIAEAAGPGIVVLEHVVQP